MNFAGRLVAGTVVVLVFAVLVVVWVSERSLRRDLEADMVRTLEREARITGNALPTKSLQRPQNIRNMAAATGHRITLTDSVGRILADSDLPPDSVGTDATIGAPEVAAIVAGAPRGVDWRPDSSGRRLFVAVESPGGIVRLSDNLAGVDETVRRAQRAVLWAGLLAIVFGSILALVAGRSIASPLTGLAQAARAIAAGSPPRFPRSGIPDIDLLVQAIRQMNRELADRFDELRLEKAESSALVESMVEGVIAANERGQIVTANPTARRMLGYDADEPIPDLPELFRVKAARTLVDTVLAGTAIESAEVEFDGKVLLVSARALPAGGAVLVLHDITEIRQLETVRRDFVANVSHELRTPLTSISGYAETLLSDPPDADTARVFLTTILKNARRMQRLVDDLLDLSRIESGRYQPRREVVEVATLAREVWAGFQDRASSRGVSFAVEIPQDSDGALVHADPDALRQVLTNLMDNALRYTPQGGRITCRATARDEGVEIALEDTGTGIPREHLPRIFERFYRADSSRSREEGGTGLGLAIVKHLVEAHGGRVRAESEWGQGTTIAAWFPNA